VFNQIDLKVYASKRLFTLLLLPSCLGVALFFAIPSQWTAAVLVALITSNLHFAYSSTLSQNRVNMLYLRGSRIYSNDKNHENLTKIIYSLWLSPKIGIICLKSIKQKRQLVFINSLSIKNAVQLRRFHVNAVHNQMLKSTERNLEHYE
jgi:hypothetical protein